MSKFIRQLAIVCSLINYIMVMSFVLAALLTEFWIQAEVRRNNNKDSELNVVYSGLFSGVRQLDWGFGPRRQYFAVLDEIHSGVSFISKATWISMIFFIALGLLWTLIGLIVALMNTLIDETSTIVGPEGFYVWSGMAFSSYLVSIILFSRQFTSTISNDVLLPEQIDAGFNSSGLAKFGISFWIFSVGALLLFVPCILIFATTKRETKRDKTTNFDDTALMY